jgi:hypothetical protein
VIPLSANFPPIAPGTPLYASFFCLPCPVAKTIDRTLYPPSPAGDRPQAPRDEGNHGPRSPPVTRGLAQRPAGQGKQPAAQRACGARPAPLSTLLLRGSLSKCGARSPPVGAHASHAPATGRVRPVPAWLRETSDDEGLTTDRQMPTCRQTRGRYKPHRFTRACRVGRSRVRVRARGRASGLPSVGRATCAAVRRSWERESAHARGQTPASPGTRPSVAGSRKCTPGSGVGYVRRVPKHARRLLGRRREVGLSARPIEAQPLHQGL